MRVQAANCFVAVPGTIIRGTSGRLTGTGTSRMNGTTTTVFVWLSPLPPILSKRYAKMPSLQGGMDSAEDNLSCLYPGLIWAEYKRGRQRLVVFGEDFWRSPLK